MSEKQKILMVTLSGDGWERCMLSEFRRHLLTKNSDPEFPFAFLFATVRGGRSALHAHNMAADTFIRHPEKPDWLWIWANDMEPTDTSMQLLYDMQANPGIDMYAMSCYIWSSKDQRPVLIAGMDNGDETYSLPNYPTGENPIHVEASGTGGLMINRRVFMDGRMMVSKPSEQDPVYTFFRDEIHPSGARGHGHDFEFTRRATRLGYKLIWCRAAWAEHVKELGLFWSAKYGHDMSIRTENGIMEYVQSMDPGFYARMVEQLQNENEFRETNRPESETESEVTNG